jgi:hypothetical protein
MSKSVSKQKKKKADKAQARTTALQKLSETFSEYKMLHPEKKWSKKMKQASKILAPILISSEKK